ncbi:MAG: tetratricopeptide repeat protein [Alphaproteobacteria bacterium]
MRRPKTAGFFKRAFTAGLLAVIILLPAPPPAFASPESGSIQADRYGDYLSARVAIINRDTQAAADFYIRAVASDPFNVALIHQAFSLAVASGRHDDAARLARRLATLDDKSTGLMELVLLVDDLRQEKLDTARTRIVDMPRTGIVALMAPLVSSWLDAWNGDFGAALADLEELEGNRGFEPFQKTHRAYILDYAGQVEEARQAYVEAVALQKGRDLRLVLAFSRFLHRHGETAAANEVLDAYTQAYPSNVLVEATRKDFESGATLAPVVNSVADGAAEAFFNTGQALANERSSTSAVIYLRLALALKSDFSVAALLLGDVLERDGRLETALEAYMMVSDHPVLGWDARFEAATLKARMDRPDDAIMVLETMAAERPTNTNLLSTLADILRGENRFEEAIGYYDRVVALVDQPAPRHWTLFYARGIALERKGAWERAEADFLKALELKPDQPLVLNYLGYSWVEKGVNLDRALMMIERAVEQRPDDGYIVDSLGWALYRTGKYEEAAAWLEKAVILRPEDPTINDHLGDAYWKVGRQLEATFQWRHALTMDPEGDDHERIREKIRYGLDSEQRSQN